MHRDLPKPLAQPRPSDSTDNEMQTKEKSDAGHIINNKRLNDSFKFISRALQWRVSGREGVGMAFSTHALN